MSVRGAYMVTLVSARAIASLAPAKNELADTARCISRAGTRLLEKDGSEPARAVSYANSINAVACAGFPDDPRYVVADRTDR